jgi:hypothetical protein
MSVHVRRPTCKPRFSFIPAEKHAVGDVITLYQKVNQFRTDGLFDKNSELSVWEQFKLKFPEVGQTVPELQELFFDPILRDFAAGEASTTKAETANDELNESLPFDHLKVSWEDVSHHNGRYYSILNDNAPEPVLKRGCKRAASQSPNRLDYQALIRNHTLTDGRAYKRPRYSQRAKVSRTLVFFTKPN